MKKSLKQGIALTPPEIVKELDRYIIGQDDAKRSVAIALRNRWRRQMVTGDIKDEIIPANILMIGPTGVGKTEISRRLAALAGAPFVKVEASKFTEVGYVGRDVESMVRDLVDVAIVQVRREYEEEVEAKAQKLANKRILELLTPKRPKTKDDNDEEIERRERIKRKLKSQLDEGVLEDRQIEVSVPESTIPTVEIFSPMGMEEMGLNISEMFDGIMPKKTKRRKVSITEARKILTQQEMDNLIDQDKVIDNALVRAQETGIIFIDEIDKVVPTSSSGGSGPDVSREGVQRDMLPIIEGSNVVTKYGLVRTNHILFIAAGAFHGSSPSDLIPELQGRLPIRVELDSLSREDFVRILTEPENSLIKQHKALLETEGILLDFSENAIEEIASIADRINSQTENIGARRLHTIMTNLLEDIMFDAADIKSRKVKITKTTVSSRLKDILADEDLTKYIL